MKVFISADIEGVAGVTHWDETYINKPEWKDACQLMTNEVKAACEGALSSGATEILLKDAHGQGRNIITTELPKEVKTIRGWAGEPFAMVQGIDESFDAALFIGYHSGAGSDDNPLAHTMGACAEFKLNGEPISEFVLNTYACALKKVPVVFVSGDEGVCSEVARFNSSIFSVGVSKGVGNSSVSVHPELSVEKIYSSTKEALKNLSKVDKTVLPTSFTMELEYKDLGDAYKACFYPGVEKIDSRRVRFVTSHFYEILRAIMFIL
jgi:D-amino peptidase